MPFDSSQINDARLNTLYNKLSEEGEFRKSLAREICTVVPKSEIPSKAAKLKVLDIRNILGSTDLGYGALDAASTEVNTQLNDRSYDIRKISGKKTYARGLEGDVLFQKIRKTFMPDLDGDIKVTEDKLLATILKGAGAAGDSRDISKTQLSAGSNETWDDDASNPLGNLEDAVKAVAANEMVFGRNKAFELKTHPQLQSQTGMKYITDDALAEFLVGFFGVKRVQIADKVYHNGAHTATLSTAQAFNDVAYVGVQGNIMFLDWSGPEFETDEDVDTNVATFVGRAHNDIITFDPDLGRAFEDVA